MEVLARRYEWRWERVEREAIAEEAGEKTRIRSCPAINTNRDDKQKNRERIARYRARLKAQGLDRNSGGLARAGVELKAHGHINTPINTPKEPHVTKSPHNVTPTVDTWWSNPLADRIRVVSGEEFDRL